MFKKFKIIRTNYFFLSVIAKGTNDAGRGINIVLVGNGKEVIKTAHFDTYAEGNLNDFMRFTS